MPTPSFPDLIKAVLESYTAEMHTAIPARVVEYFHSRQEATVQPVIKKRYYDAGGAEDGLEEMAPIVAVPVVFPAAAGGTLTFPIKKGDLVLLVFSERSIDKFNVSDGKTMIDPDDYRKFSYNDAIAIPGIFPQEPSYGSHPDDVVIKYKTATGRSSLSFSPDGTVSVDCNNFIVNTGNFSVQANQVNLKAKNNLLLEAEKYLDLVSFDTLEVSSPKLYDFSVDRKTSSLYKQTEIKTDGNYTILVDGKWSLTSNEDMVFDSSKKISLKSGQDFIVNSSGKVTSLSTGITAINSNAGLSLNSSGVTALDGTSIKIGEGGTSGSEAPVTTEELQLIPANPDGFVTLNKKIVFKQAKGKIVDNSKFIILDATNRQGATAFIYIKPQVPSIDWLTLTPGGNGKVGDSVTVENNNQHFVHLKINDFANSLQIGTYVCQVVFNKAANPDADQWDYCDIELQVIE